MHLIRCAALIAAGVGCRTTPTIPGDMRLLEGSADPMYWERHGYLELTGPIRPPTTVEGTTRIIVYLRVPDGATITDGAMPDGTAAARVELAAPAGDVDAAVAPTWRVLDVRSFAWREGRVECSVLRPDGDGSLIGLAWPCSETNDRRAGAVLASLATAGRMAARREAARDRAAHHLVQINGCTQCHTPNRTEDRRPGVLVQRGTDASGLFTVRSLFRDEDVAERYRPVDSNRRDPLVTTTCPDSQEPSWRERCPDGQWSRRRYDLASGLASGAPHASRICAARQKLAARMAPPLSASVTEALAPCTVRPTR